MRKHLPFGFDILLAICVLAVPPTGYADSPQFQVDQAQYSFNAYQQDATGWDCDPVLTDLSHGSSCYGMYAASFVMGESIVASQAPNGVIIWHTNPSPDRDGGYLDPEAFDELVSWKAGSAQGGPHHLRQVLYDRDRTTANSQPPLSWSADKADSELGAQRYVANSAFYEPELARHVTAVTIFNSAKFPSNHMSGLYMVTSASGYDNFFWYEIFRSIRPDQTSTQSDGAEWHFNKAGLVNDPSSDSRWIGLIKASHLSLNNVMTPIIVDFVNQTVSFKFVNEGWCSFPWNVHFTDFDPTPNTTCDNAYDPNTHTATIPDVFAGTGNPYPQDFLNLEIVDGKFIALKSTFFGAPLQGAFVSGTALCPYYLVDSEGVNYEYLYEERSRQSPFAGGYNFYTREVSPATWTSNTGGIIWVGAQKQILDGDQAQQFHIQPTDSKALGGFSAELQQYNSGKVFLYLNAKVTLCELNNKPAPDAWNRGPIGGSGGALVWLRLFH